MFKNLKNNIFIKLFNSIPTAIIILCLITAACIAGTLIPQNRGPAFYFQNYGGTIFNFIMIFSLNDLYHSIWFISLLVMLCLNITVCTAMRIKPLFKAAKINDPVIPETLAGNLNIKKEFILQTECNEETTISNISGIIKSSFENKKYKTYDTLKNAARRAKYLLEKQGIDAVADTNTALPMDFLMQQMEWREQLEDAKAARDIDALDDLHKQLRAEAKKLETELIGLFDHKKDYAGATEVTRKLIFIDKVSADIQQAIEHLD